MLWHREDAHPKKWNMLTKSYLIKQNIMIHINIICFEVISFHGFKIVYTNKINSFHIGT